MNNQPLVSVPVITYNSAKYVLETLESVKAQTYQNIELIISDDCSTDNTVELCQQWIEYNKDRFVRTQLITVDKNTGISANLNRAEAACQGEWVKGIAGDDVLLPECISDCIDYALQTPDVIYLFARVKVFGAKEDINLYFEKSTFDYSFFDQCLEDQLERLIFKGNCIPASTLFYNRAKIYEYGITNDERIPLLEDWPKWINALGKGIKFHFMDKQIVNYRIHEGSLSTVGILSTRYVNANVLFDLLYRYPKWLEQYPNLASERYAEYLSNIYSNVYEELRRTQNELQSITSSITYRIVFTLLKPFKKIKRLIKK